MAYERKTQDVWDIYGNYGEGWELVTAETTWKGTKQRLREYRENEPGVPFKWKKKRERIEGKE